MRVAVPLLCGGSLAYWRLLASTDTLVDVNEHFQKQTPRNRIEILGPNGVQLLTLPVVKKGERRPMHAVQLNPEQRWRAQNWKSLEMAYRRSPYFEFYEDDLKPLFLSNIDLLGEFNLALIECVSRLGKVPVAMVQSESYQQAMDWGQSFHTVPFGIGSSHEFQPYNQVFSDRHAFVPHLSVLDALFCVGPRLGNLLNLG